MLKAIIIGHLGKDATIRDVNGKNAIGFSVAHSEKYKNSKGENVEKTTWLDCTYWSDKTGIVPYLLKGTQVYVEGTPEASTYENKNREVVPVFRLRVMNIQLLGSSEAAKPAAKPVATDQEPEDDNLPF